jgi:hypothetical protein
MVSESTVSKRCFKLEEKTSTTLSAIDFKNSSNCLPYLCKLHRPHSYVTWSQLSMMCSLALQQLPPSLFKTSTQAPNDGKIIHRPYPSPLCWFPMWPTLPLSLFLYSWLFPTGGLVCSHLLTLVPRSRTFLPWRWRRYVPPKRRLTQDPRRHFLWHVS